MKTVMTWVAVLRKITPYNMLNKQSIMKYKIVCDTSLIPEILCQNFFYNIANKICVIKFNCASVLHIPIMHAHDISKQIPQEKKFSIRLKMLWNNWFIYQLCVHRDMKHLGSLESTQEARVVLGYASSNSYASFMLSKLPVCFISPWTLADIWTNC